MRVFRFHLPDTANNGADYSEGRAKFLRHCLALCGGYTLAQPVRGAWRDTASQADYIETMHPVDVAVPDAQCYKREMLRDLFLKKCFPDQLAVYSAEVGQAWIEGR